MQIHIADDLSRDVDEFLSALTQAEVPAPGGPISGLDWLTSKDPLAKQIRCFVLILSNWPTEHAPWAILQPMLRLAMHRVTTGEITEISRCEFRYARTRNNSGTQCPNKSVTSDHRCDIHRGRP